MSDPVKADRFGCLVLAMRQPVMTTHIYLKGSYRSRQVPAGASVRRALLVLLRCLVKLNSCTHQMTVSLSIPLSNINISLDKIELSTHTSIF